jgi:hypothetical protein
MNKSVFTALGVALSLSGSAAFAETPQSGAQSGVAAAPEAKATPQATATPAENSSTLAELPITRATLENGLRVVMSPDRTIPTVGIAVYYDVGSRNEVRGRSGFAHLFEHMMFQGSANVGKASTSSSS